MTICEYIKSHSRLNRLPFLEVYVVITELLKDGKLKDTEFVESLF